MTTNAAPSQVFSSEAIGQQARCEPQESDGRRAEKPRNILDAILEAPLPDLPAPRRAGRRFSWPRVCGHVTPIARDFVRSRSIIPRGETAYTGSAISTVTLLRRTRLSWLPHR